MLNLYFDNAASSFPKPLEVAEYTRMYLERGGTYGRGAYDRVINVSRTVEETRFLLSQLMGTSLFENVIFTHNSTHAINIVLQGFKYKFKRVLISPLEHNAVTRPIEHLREKIGLKFDVIPHKSDGQISLEELGQLDLNRYDLCIINHISNVNGVIQPISKVKQVIGNLPLLVDASQSAGYFELEADKWNVDFIALTAHKGLMGPTGVGCLFIRNTELVSPLMFGGTGSRSDSFLMPEHLPDRYEPGTPNILGIYGLNGALKANVDFGFTRNDFKGLLSDIERLNTIKVYRSKSFENQGYVFSITSNNLSSSDLADILFRKYKIETRSGLHCSPLAHQTLGTMPQGTVRFSLSKYHSPNDLSYIYKALNEIDNEQG
ncbi:MAG: hypothetical protein PWR03_1451 [Tenuifilum sp.]|jgi:cysteine desulfurase family protein|uniref:aminotransferase class V-fold PLP-dependent enzyme n=1 Tax=Tenuifilum sp. TaxID=2760880 RepID=UPI0024AB7A8D|nr:aminotransferase class V-fold PLP-dependent enzyme [Tenuifilum sp.]MDI3527268.1 hypothetical protein [Tenuifilum sp.]